MLPAAKEDAAEAEEAPAAPPTFALRSASSLDMSSSRSSLELPARKEEAADGAAFGSPVPPMAPAPAAGMGGTLTPMVEKAREIAEDTACVVALCTATERSLAEAVGLVGSWGG